MNIQAQSNDPFASRSDLLVIMLSKGNRGARISVLTKKLDKILEGVINSLISNLDITGDEGEMSLIYTPNLGSKGFYPKKIIVMGVGNVELLSSNKARKSKKKLN